MEKVVRKIHGVGDLEGWRSKQLAELEGFQ